MEILIKREQKTEVTNEFIQNLHSVVLYFLTRPAVKIRNPPGPQGEGASSFLAMLASSSTEEMEAELQQRVESSRKLASCAVEICESVKGTVEQLKKDLDSDTGEREIVGLYIQTHKYHRLYGLCYKPYNLSC